MLIGRHSFIRQSKLSDVAGRIDYISNPKRQEHLYATYQTEGATPEFWKNLARENQLDFKARGTAGKCIEGREFIKMCIRDRPIQRNYLNWAFRYLACATVHSL